MVPAKAAVRLGAFVAAFWPSLWAVAGTQVWEVRGLAKLAEGKLDGAIITGSGELRMGWTTKRIELKVDSVWCLLPDGRGGALAGTGPKGEIFSIKADSAERLVETGSLAVTVLRRTPDGVLAGTIPEGRIYRIDEDGKFSEFAKLDAKYIWDIMAAPDGSVYVATGPDGKLFRISGGKVELWFKSKEANLLCLAPAGRDALYVGSGEKGLLFRVDGRDSAVVVYDFDENEVRAIVAGEGELFIAANAAKSRASPASTSETKATDTKPSQSASDKRDVPPSKEPMDCAIYRLLPNGSVEQIFSSKGEFIWALEMLADGQLLAATGERGRVYRVRPPAVGDQVLEGGGADVLFDLDEGQALALGMDFGRLSFIGTGNGGAVYAISQVAPGAGVYTSKVLDAKTVASWGLMEWEATGKLQLETRSGATPEPDESWGPWRAVEAGRHIASDRARYLQFRAALGASDALLKGVRVYYAPDNRRPNISSVELAVEAAQPGGTKEAKKDQPASILPAPNTVKNIKWTAKDPDGDELIFRLFYKLVGEPDDAFRTIVPRGEPVTGDKYAWDTRGLPDGRYIVRVVASDERANPPPSARATACDSEPILVDNTAPEILELRLTEGKLSGVARDSASRIAYISYMLDGGWPVLVAPEDGIFDSREERFRAELAAGKGVHAVAVHVADEAGNLAVARIAFKIE